MSRPSSLAQDIACPGSRAMSLGLPEEDSVYAAQGTFQHFVAAECLRENSHPRSFLGRRVLVCASTSHAEWYDEAKPLPEGPEWSLHDINATQVNLLADYVTFAQKEFIDKGFPHWIEEPVPVSEWCGSRGATCGTPDFVAIEGRRIIVLDRKLPFGRDVDAFENFQAMAYGYGAYLKYWSEHGDPLEDPEFTIIIHQGNKVDPWGPVTLAELEEYRKTAFAAAERSQDLVAQCVGFSTPPEWIVTGFLRPSEKACAYCKAKPRCPKLLSTVQASIFDDATQEVTPSAVAEVTLAVQAGGIDNEQLGRMKAAFPLIKQWMTAVDAALYREAEAGNPTPGWKLVAGRAGNRDWEDEATVEDTLKSKWKLPTGLTHVEKLRSPTALLDTIKAQNPELLNVKVRGAKGPLGQALTRADVIQTWVSRAPPKPTLVAEDDPRPALARGLADAELAELVDKIDPAENINEEPL